MMWYVVCVMVGALIGFVVAALLAAGKDERRDNVANPDGSLAFTVTVIDIDAGTASHLMDTYPNTKLALTKHQ